MKNTIIYILTLFLLSVSILCSVIYKQHQQIKEWKATTDRAIQIIETYQYKEDKCFELYTRPHARIQYSYDGVNWTEFKYLRYGKPE